MPRLLRKLELSLELSKASPLPVRFSLADDFRWITDCDGIAGNISCNNGARAYERVLAYSYSRVYGASSPDGGELLDPSLEQRPVTMGSRVFVVGKGDIGPDENAVFDRYSGRDKDKRPDLAIVAYRDAFFDIDISVYFRVLADSAAVEVYVIVDERAFPDLSLLDNRVSWVLSHFAEISGAAGIWTCIVRSWRIDSRAASKTLTTRAPRTPSDWLEKGLES